MGYLNDDEDIALSSHALDALREFYADRDALKAKFEDLRTEAEKRQDEASAKPISIHDFGEDWQESQFWYSDDTANLIARQLLDGTSAQSTIVAVSAPSVFIALKNAIASRDEASRPKLVLLEHDSRFAVFPEYVFYDYNQPLKLPDGLKSSADGVACDPPFLNVDCQSKEAATVRWLSKSGQGTRVVLCTGERMESIVAGAGGVYGNLGLRTTTFQPEHSNKLSNEFYCYANFECADWAWRAQGDGTGAAVAA